MTILQKVVYLVVIFMLVQASIKFSEELDYYKNSRVAIAVTDDVEIQKLKPTVYKINYKLTYPVDSTESRQLPYSMMEHYLQHELPSKDYFLKNQFYIRFIPTHLQAESSHSDLILVSKERGYSFLGMLQPFFFPLTLFLFVVIVSYIFKQVPSNRNSFQQISE